MSLMSWSRTATFSGTALVLRLDLRLSPKWVGCVTRSVGVPWSQLRPVPQSATKVKLASDDNLTEVAFCKSIRDDDDGTELRLALKHYPGGAFADFARTPIGS